MNSTRALIVVGMFIAGLMVTVTPISAACFEQVTYVGFNYDHVSGDAPLTVQFTPVVESTKLIGRCEWDFGDGTPVQTSTYIPVSHTYTDPGTYSVTLTAYNDCGMSAAKTASGAITVTSGTTCPVIPVADFLISPDGGYPYSVSFTDTSTGAAKWAWDFGDQTTSSSQNPTHKFTNDETTPVTRTITLTITDSCGNTATKQDTVTVPSGKVCKLQITTVPTGASFTIDGVVTNYAPATYGLQCTPHTIIIWLDGYNTVTKTVTLVEGKKTELNVALTKTASESKTGSLKVITTPTGASVSLNGDLQGTSPTTISDLSAGTYNLKVTRTGYTDFTQSVTVTAGKETQVTLTLVKKDGTTKPDTSLTTPPAGSTGAVSITSAPSGASVSFDGGDKGKTPITLKNVNAGSHTLKLTLAGYQDKTLTVPVEAGKTTTVTAGLDPSGASPSTGRSNVTIRSSPPGANVYLDGGNVGKTPVMLQGVAAGTHNLLLTMQDYSDVSQKIEVTAGSDKEITIDLGKKAPGFALPVTLAALAAIAILAGNRRKVR